MIFPSTAVIENLDTKHPQYIRNERLMQDLKILYAGGDLMRKNAARFLMKRSKEIGPVYQDRLLKVTYDNLLSAIAVWFTAKLYENSLAYDFKSDQADEGASATPKKQPPTPPFYAEFLEDCDNAGTTLEKFFERLTADVLVFGAAYFLIDLPQLAVEPSTLAEQKALGALNPYLVYYEPTTIQNWSQDAFGALEWVTIHTVRTEQEFLGPLWTVERWTYYDKNEFAVYESRYQDGKKNIAANLISSGNHALSDQNGVPLKIINADDRLWLGNRVLLPLIEHFNTDNSLGWSLWLANNPIPTFHDGKDGAKVDISQTAAEYSAINIPEGGDFKWVEPEGKSWTSSQERLNNLKDGIFRSCHLLAQAKTSRGSDYQSGLSKEVQVQPAVDVLNILGSLIRTAIQNALSAVSAIRGDGTIPDVRGMNFADDQSGEITSLTLELQSVNVPSATFKKEMYKKLIRTVLRDANASVAEQCVHEVEVAPDDTAVVAPASAVNLNITERGSVS